jgi:hypothetical protein
VLPDDAPYQTDTGEYLLLDGQTELALECFRIGA